jgi:hypothetical protein
VLCVVLCVLGVCVCVCVCVCGVLQTQNITYIHTHTYTYTHTYIHTHTYTYTYTTFWYYASAPYGMSKESIYDGTRKIVNYAWTGSSQKKFWWLSELLLTCKSFVRFEYRGERLIELFGSWFSSKFPPGLLRFENLFD